MEAGSEGSGTNDLNHLPFQQLRPSHVPIQTIPRESWNRAVTELLESPSALVRYFTEYCAASVKIVHNNNSSTDIERLIMRLNGF